MNDTSIRICELFAGIGGFRYGFEKASTRFQTVYANEYNQWPASIYRYHHPDNTLQEKDIRNVNIDEVPEFDFLVGGFPCQPFSYAGKRQGLQDPRGTLFNQIIRFAKEKQPKLLLLENVPGLLSIDYGETFETIIQCLAQLGYICEWKILDSQYFGVPQRRRRIYIAAYLAATTRSATTFFPLTPPNRGAAKKTAKKQVCPTLTASSHKLNYGGQLFLMQQHTSCEVRLYPDKAPTLMANLGTGGGNVPFVCSESACVRRLTIIECERLQGFPDDYTKYGLNSRGEQFEVSKTQRLKAIGNAVTTNVITSLGHLTLNFLQSNFKEGSW